MPTYEFVCEQCTFYFTRQLGIEEREQQQSCPDCHSKMGPRRVTFAAPGTCFKGCGWTPKSGNGRTQ